MNCMINDLLLNSTDTIAPMDRRNNRKTATITPIAAEFLKKKVIFNILKLLEVLTKKMFLHFSYLI